jgi:hypothetical protein
VAGQGCGGLFLHVTDHAAFAAYRTTLGTAALRARTVAAALRLAAAAVRVRDREACRSTSSPAAPEVREAIDGGEDPAPHAQVDATAFAERTRAARAYG